MDSKDNTSLTGFTSVTSDNIETVNAVTNSVNNDKNSSSLNVVVSSDVDETEAIERVVVVDDDNLAAKETLAVNVNLDEGENFIEPSEFTKVDDEVVGDDVGNDKLGLVENKFGENLSDLEPNEAVKDKVVEKEDLGDETEDKEVVVANGVKVTAEGDAIVEEIKVDTPEPGVAVVVTNVDEVDDEDEDEDVLLVGGSDGVDDVNVNSEGDSVVDAVKTAVETRGLESGGEDDLNVSSGGDLVVDVKPVVETSGLESVDAKDVKVTPEGDAVVEAINVDLPLPGLANVAVVTKIDDVENVKSTEVLTKGMPEDADNGLENGSADKFVLEESAKKDEANEQEYTDGSHSDEEDTEAAKNFIEELEGGESSQDRSQVDGQIVTDSDEEDDEDDGKELFDSAALAALLKAAADGSSEGGNITFSSEDGSRVFTVERPAGLGSSLQAMRAAPRPPRANIFNPSSLMSGNETEPNLSEEEKKKLEKLQAIRVKFLRLVQRLGLSPDESVAAQVLYRLALIAGRQTGQSFSLEAAKRKAAELEADGNTDLDFSVNILVIGKAGVGKSATINSIFGEEKTPVGAFDTATGSVKEITGVVGGVTVRVFDTPGLKTSVMEQGYNRSVLASAKKATKKNPPDIVLYVDRLDAQTRDHNDIPLLKTITTSLGSAIWRSAIVTFTHGASAPPEGSNGHPLSYEVFVTQRSHVVQQAIGRAVGDLRMMSPGLMNPVSLVENHPSCRKNREGQKVLPNGQTWRPQLLMLCYSMKISSEANSLTKPQDPFDSRKLFGFRMRSPPLPYMLSSMLQSRAHPKLATDQGGDVGDSDIDLAELTDSDHEEEEDEYDQLPPFKPLKRSQLAKLSKEQKKAYYDEYDYRVKLLQKKQWKEELKRMKELKKKGPGGLTGQTYQEEEGEGDAPAPVAVPLPDMALPPSFDSDNPAYRFRFLEPTSQFLARPVLDTHGWDHDCGYDGVNVEQTLAIANRFPAAVSVQVTKDKKDFSINMDSSISAKHGENVSTMAGFDIQPIGKQLAYIVRGETKFKNLKKNKTAAGMSVTFLGENVVTGFKVEDQITLGRQYSVVGSAGTVLFQADSAYGANIEVQRRELDYPIGQVQSTIGLSIIKWRGDLALGLNSLAQFSVGRNSKVAVRAGINNKMSGQITVKTSSSEYLSLALAAVIPSLISAYKKLPSVAGAGGDGDKYY